MESRNQMVILRSSYTSIPENFSSKSYMLCQFSKIEKVSFIFSGKYLSFGAHKNYPGLTCIPFLKSFRFREKEYLKYEKVLEKKRMCCVGTTEKSIFSSKNPIQGCAPNMRNLQHNGFIFRRLLEYFRTARGWGR